MDALGPIAVVAGGGRLPAQVIRAAELSGREVITIAIKGEADASLSAFDPVVLGWGQIGKLFDTIHQAGAKEVVLIGSVTRRPDFTSIVGDLGTMRRLPRILSALVGGDDSLLVRVMGIFEREGLRVIGAHELAPELLASGGVMAGPYPDDQDNLAVKLGLEAVRMLGALDIGQAAIAVGTRVVAVEGAEGTDAMLVRCRDLRENGRVRAKGRVGVLVKCAKPDQDLRVDLPTVGPDTVRRAQAAQLKGIAVEAGRVLISDREETLAVCNELGIFLLGIEARAKEPTP
ncbi:LpxI family protein [Pseudovibrio exalbescens]|uniref:LpxI family protein n=1 Tax=Pseudovibrio exalbescens TaxID=197461 RepID=UPI000C9C0FBB|nr:UDP-2,3-diacylglucosamine diphosphatase LpxI [Pseudovibrio exalbescens]